jgi:hypothetical protein
MIMVESVTSPRKPVPPTGPGWKRVTDDTSQAAFFTFEEPGDTIEGVYLDTKMIKERERHLLRTADREIHILPDHFRLREALEDVEPGSLVYIAYTGEQTIPGRMSAMKVYDVYVKPPEPRRKGATSSVREEMSTPDDPGEPEEDVPF